MFVRLNLICIAYNPFMGYFNYHAKAKNLIKNGELCSFEFVDSYNNISPALVLYFKNNRPMPIRQYRWHEYLPLLENIK